MTGEIQIFTCNIIENTKKCSDCCLRFVCIDLTVEYNVRLYFKTTINKSYILVLNFSLSTLMDNNRNI